MLEELATEKRMNKHLRQEVEKYKGADEEFQGLVTEYSTLLLQINERKACLRSFDLIELL